MVRKNRIEADVNHTLTNTKEIVLVQLNHYFERKLGSTLYAFYPHTHTPCAIHMLLCTSVQGYKQRRGVHHCPGTNEVHLSRLLEDGL